MKQQSYLVLWLLGEGMSDIENYLNALIDVQHKCHNTNGAPREGWEYLCIEDFVLREGQPFAAPSSVELPSDVSQGIVKECFKNCVNSVAMRGTDYLYCEGYALGIIPMLHAWLVSPDGQVIDPTCENLGRSILASCLIASLSLGKHLNRKRTVCWTLTQLDGLF